MRPSLLLPFLFLAGGTAHAQLTPCSQARIAAPTDQAGVSRVSQDILAAEKELETSLSRLIVQNLGQKNRERLLAYYTREKGAPSTDEVSEILNSLRLSVPEYTKARCADSSEEPAYEDGYANVPASRSGFSLCRKVTHEETPGNFMHNLSELGAFFTKPYSCGVAPETGDFAGAFLAYLDAENVELPSCETTPIVGPSTTRTYSYRFPRVDRSVDILEPESVTHTLSGVAPVTKDRFKLRICYGTSPDTIHVSRMCRILDLKEIVDYTPGGGSTLVAQSSPALARISEGLCEAAELSLVLQEKSIVITESTQVERPKPPTEGERIARKGTAVNAAQ